MGLPPLPGPGRYPMPLNEPGFYLLLLLLGTFGLILFLLHRLYPGRQRALDGFFEAASVDLAFLIVGLGILLALVGVDGHGNRTDLALYHVIVSGYWFSFSIPVVTVGISVEDRSRGTVQWKLPSLLAAGALFAVLFGYYFAIA